MELNSLETKEIEDLKPRRKANFKEIANNNIVRIKGIAEKDFEFNHKYYDERFFKTVLQVERKSGIIDRIPILVSEIILPNIEKRNIKGKNIEVSGEFRSVNKNRHLILFVLVKRITICDYSMQIENSIRDLNYNFIYLNGFICKKPIFRTTPSGIKITDLCVAVNRRYRKSDYIPCIVWQRGALLSSIMNIGDNIQLYGRIQSRTYPKNHTILEVNEVSAMFMEKIN